MEYEKNEKSEKVRRKRILVIDDDEMIRKSFTLSLEDMEYQVDTAETGEKGLEMKKEGKWDLIFLDLRMPGMNGVETLREIRKIDTDVIIYIITAYHKEFFDELEIAVKEGMDFELLKKPVEKDQIVEVVKGVLGD